MGQEPPNSYYRKEALAERSREKSLSDYAHRLAEANPGYIIKGGRSQYYYYPDSDTRSHLTVEHTCKVSSSGMETGHRYTVRLTYDDGRVEQLTKTHSRRRTTSEKRTDARETFHENIDGEPDSVAVDELMEAGYSGKFSHLTQPEQPENTERAEPTKEPYGSSALCPDCGWAHFLGKGFYMEPESQTGGERLCVCDVCGYRTAKEDEFRWEFNQLTDVSGVPEDTEHAYDPEKWDVPDDSPEKSRNYYTDYRGEE